MTADTRGERQPSLFLSHGAPTLALADSEAHRFLRTFTHGSPRPTAIVVVSAHFDAPVTTITAGESPGTIHDFGGFPPALYELQYPAAGSPKLALRIAGLLTEAGWGCELDAARGFDHGAWIPLLLMFPAADIPLVQVSVDAARSPAFHWRLGRLLRPLRDEGVLLIGSGGAVHNLREIDWRDGSEPPLWARAFEGWLHSAIAEGRDEDILEYRSRAPNAVLNHPTEEHFLPLPFAIGAAFDDEPRVRVHQSWDYGSLAMDAYRFGTG